MARNREYIGIDCPNCGVHGNGKRTENNRVQCGDCGKLGSEADQYCEIHDLHYAGLYPNDNHCPWCREESRIQGMREHDMTRDPQVEPW